MLSAYMAITIVSHMPSVLPGQYALTKVSCCPRFLCKGGAGTMLCYQKLKYGSPTSLFPELGRCAHELWYAQLQNVRRRQEGETTRSPESSLIKI